MAPADSLARLSALRALMKEHSLDAYIVPSEDAHACEYLSPCDARRAFLTSFTGSAGTAVVTHTDARCWTDGRYWLQAEKQLGEGWTLVKAGLPDEPTVGKWLKDTMARSSKIGIDPTLMPFGEYQKLAAVLSGTDSTSSSPPAASASASGNISTPSGPTLVPITVNFPDALWTDRPARPSSDVFLLDAKYAGEAAKDKLSSLQDQLKAMGCPGVVVAQLDEVAWLFNLRGSDIPFNPVFFAYALITPTRATLFAQPASLSSTVVESLQAVGVQLEAYDKFWDVLGAYAVGVRADRAQRAKAEAESAGSAGVDVEMQEPPEKRLKAEDGSARLSEASTTADGTGVAEKKETEGGKKETVVKTDKVLLGSKVSWAVARAIGEEHVEVRRSLVEDKKAIKNETEIEGFRQCHIRDGAALVRYFAWLEEVLTNGEEWTEYDAASVLEKYRSENELFKGLSFETISSTGPNAAVIHYAPPEKGSAIIDPKQMYLCDSGAQYLDGTTDTTRTLHFGSPSEEEKRAFTRVLQGHIALDTAVFPVGTTGYVLDILARRPLWQDGLDYRHGTGHGVGSFLNVHEGPQGVGQRIAYNDIALAAGHVLSNEPGYYADGKWGIRIENVVVCRKADTANNFGGRGYLGFERLTMCPIQTKLVLSDLLSPDERQWVNEYHAEVRDRVGPVLRAFGDERALGWLEKECRAI